MKALKSQILLLNRSFWPDIEATGQFLTELCEHLAQRHRVSVIAGRSYYKESKISSKTIFCNNETYKNITIFRIRHTNFWKRNILARIMNWLTYSINAFFVALRIKTDVIITCTDPPFLGIIGMTLSRLKRIPFIYNCRDLYPEVGIAIGKLKKHSVLAFLFDWLNKKALYSTTLVVCLGQSMEKKIIAKGVPRERVVSITDWVDTAAIKPISKKDNILLKKLGLSEKFIIMYSGNMGLTQGLDAILDALIFTKGDDSIVTIFAGNGVARKELEKKRERLGLDNVLFLNYQPADKLALSLGMADVHLVPLKEGLSGAIVPSKLYGIMAAGRPYIAIMDRYGEPACIAEEYGCGKWVKPGDPLALEKALRWAMENRDALDEMGSIGRRIAEARFDKRVIMARWLAAISSVCKG